MQACPTLTHSLSSPSVFFTFLQLISLAPFLLLFLIYLCRRSSGGPLLSSRLLKLFVAFAVGGLLGDAFLHLIPHAMNPHSHAHAEPVDILAKLSQLTLPSFNVRAQFEKHTAASTSSFATPPPTMVHTQERGHAHSSAHSHSHSHSHDEVEVGHAKGHAHSHSHDAPTVTPIKERGAASGHSHSHSHDDTPKERGSAAGHSHSHSHDSAPTKKSVTPPPPSQTLKEAGSAHGHSHSHSDAPNERGHTHGHSHSAHSHDDHHHAHAHDDHDHHGHDHSAGMNVGLCILLGMFAFFTIEKLARAHSGGEGGHGHSHGGHGHSHGGAAATSSSSAHACSDSDSDDSSEAKSSIRLRKTKKTSSEFSFDAQVPEKSHDDDEPIVTADQRITGLLNLIGDFSHNFTDGMAIAASYLAGGHVGVSTTLAVLIHEVPHEIGDFAILLQSGFTVPAALKAQLLTAIGALAGCCFGYYSGATDEAAQSSWIIPFTAGGFIYVACVNVLPTLLPHESFKQTLAEMLAMGLGVALMVLIAALE